MMLMMKNSRSSDLLPVFYDCKYLSIVVYDVYHSPDSEEYM